MVPPPSPVEVGRSFEVDTPLRYALFFAAVGFGLGAVQCAATEAVTVAAVPLGLIGGGLFVAWVMLRTFYSFDPAKKMVTRETRIAGWRSEKRMVWFRDVLAASVIATR